MKFYDGSYHELTANQMVKAMFLNIDAEGHQLQLLIEIADHKSDGNAISISDGFIKLRNGKNVPKRPHLDGKCKWSERVDQHPGFH